MEVEREAEHLRGDHPPSRIRTLSDVHRAGGHRATSPACNVTIATDVVGAMLASKLIAMPRPRGRPAAAI